MTDTTEALITGLCDLAAKMVNDKWPQETRDQVTNILSLVRKKALEDALAAITGISDDGLPLAGLFEAAERINFLIARGR